jgi:hypothetical protein
MQALKYAMYVSSRGRLESKPHSSALTVSWYSRRSDGSVPVLQAPASSLGTLLGSLLIVL